MLGSFDSTSTRHTGRGQRRQSACPVHVLDCSVVVVVVCCTITIGYLLLSKQQQQHATVLLLRTVHWVGFHNGIFMYGFPIPNYPITLLRTVRHYVSTPLPCSYVLPPLLRRRYPPPPALQQQTTIRRIERIQPNHPLPAYSNCSCIKIVACEPVTCHPK